MQYTAETHEPGCLPDTDDVPTFDTARDAWAHLIEEFDLFCDGELTFVDQQVVIEMRQAKVANAPGIVIDKHGLIWCVEIGEVND